MKLATRCLVLYSLFSLPLTSNAQLCSTDSTLFHCDFDGDGVVNHLDADIDNDGILNINECSTTVNFEDSLNTGRNTAAGANDPNWSVEWIYNSAYDHGYASSEYAPILTPGIVPSRTISNLAPGAWVNNGAPSYGWISYPFTGSINSDGDHTDLDLDGVHNEYTGGTSPVGTGDQVQLKFSNSLVLSHNQALAGEIYFEYACDNYIVDVIVNGTSQGGIPASYSSFLSHTITADLIAGNNTIELVIQSGPGLAGLIIRNATIKEFCDTDSDGNTDVLDLDSDNDGCGDAYEGAANLFGANVDAQGMLTGGVDANGVPIIVGASGQAVGASANDLIKDINCPCDLISPSPSCDFDNDGIINSLDLDDDNDGILDVNECFTVTSFEDSLNTGRNLTAGQDDPSWTVEWIYDPAYNAGFPAHEFAPIATPGVLPGRVVSNLAPGIWSNNNVPDYSWVTFPFTGPANADGQHTDADLDGIHNEYSGGGGVGIVGTGDQVQIRFTTTVVLTPGQAAASEIYFEYACDNSVVDVIVNGVSQGSIPSSFAFASHTITADLINGTNTIEMVVQSGPGLVGLIIRNATIKSLCDTDGDGVFDQFDTDSDNDGCSDSFEAGHTDSDSDGQLGNSPVTVDPNGVVTGQGGYTGTTAAVTDNTVNFACAHTAGNESMTLNEDSGATNSPNILSNNTQPDSDTLIVAIGTSSGGGTITYSPSDSTILYTPAPNFNGVDTVTYTVCDTLTPPNCVNDTLFVTVTPVNDPPVVDNEFNVIDEDNPATGDLTDAGDSDIDGNLVVNTSPLSGPSNGSVVINADGTYTYTPDPNFNGNDTIIVEICDDGTPLPAECTNDTIFVTVNPVNDAPIVDNEYETGNVNVLVTGDLTDAGDSDLDGNLVVNTTPVGGPNNGSILINADGTYTYTPNTNWFGQDTIVVEICDDGTPLPAICVNDTIFIDIAACPAPMDDDGDGLTNCEETTGIDDPSTPATPTGTTDPNDPCDPIGLIATDTDGDGLTDCEETTGIDDPSTPATPTGTTDPNDPCDPIGLVTTDTDGDGLTDCEETTGIDDPSTPATPTGTTDPNDPCDPIGLITTDTDGDGLTDCEETTGIDDPSTPATPTGTTDPNDPCDPIGLITTDSDGDGLTDCEETTGIDDPSTLATPAGTTDPNDPCDPIGLVTTDTDGDGLTDCEETTGIDDPSTPATPTGTTAPNDPCDPIGLINTDSDGDGLTDCEETTGIDDPSTPATPTGTTDPNDPCDPIGLITTDTDGDGLTDCEETTGIDDPSTPATPTGTTDPNDPCDPIGLITTDTDGDGLTDCEETTGIDDPSTPATPTGTTDPNDPCDPIGLITTDTDGDGLTDCEETTGIDDPSTPATPTGTTDPNDPCDPIGLITTDTDGDGLTDCEETTGIDDPSTPATPTGTTDPNDPCDPIGLITTDTDGDGLTDCEETTGIDDPSTPATPTGTTDPNDPCDPIGLVTTDTDGDGLTDCEETTGIDDPSTPATPTGTTDPNDPCDPIGLISTDSDGDGLTDCEETTGIDDPSTPATPTGTTDPNDPCDPIGLINTDSDGDGLTDCEETTGIDDPSTPATPTGTTDPNDPCDPIGLVTTDTDGDGLTDCEETTGIDDPSTPATPTGTTDPNDPCDPIGLITTDTDGDGLTDCEETTGIDDPSTPLSPAGTSDPNDECDPFICDLIIPEAFTPNGDNVNDLFIIEGIEQFPNNSIIIFNRWGNQVFIMDNYDNSWDGTTNSGRTIGGNELPTGTYFYILDAGDSSFKDKGVFKGYVYLQR